ncbi:hypothetical protein NF315_000563 [Salmonella enterica]|nr:hypothetical protein [Salmonella enterica]
MVVPAINKSLFIRHKGYILTTHTTNLVLDLERLDWSRRANCFACHAADIPVSSGIFYEIGSDELKHTSSTNATGQPEVYFYQGHLQGSAFHCPYCGPYVVSRSLMATANAADRVQTYLNRHPEYRNNPTVIHNANVDF